MPTDRDLLISSREFAKETRLISWWHLFTTIMALALSMAIASLGELTWIRAFGSILAGLVIVRTFVLYHDYQHHAIFRGATFPGLVLNLSGLLMLTPPSTWKCSHNQHHSNNSKIRGPNVGSFPIMTVSDYQKSTWISRLQYRLCRSPIVIVLGYLVVFLYGMCLQPFYSNPRQHIDSLLSVSLHFGLMFVIGLNFGWSMALFTFILPMWIAMAIGTYLFYVQHNFPGAELRDASYWSYTQAALKSSSYLRMGALMNWFTGNIGYHHVHHLNSKIPFYRLPEAMAALVPLQSPKVVTLAIRDIVGSLRLKLWDIDRSCLVTFSEAATSDSSRVK